MLLACLISHTSKVVTGSKVLNMLDAKVWDSRVGISWEFPMSREEKFKRLITLSELEFASLHRDLAEAQSKNEQSDVVEAVWSESDIATESESDEGAQQSSRRSSGCMDKESQKESQNRLSSVSTATSSTTLDLSTVKATTTGPDDGEGTKRTSRRSSHSAEHSQVPFPRHAEMTSWSQRMHALGNRNKESQNGLRLKISNLLAAEESQTMAVTSPRQSKKQNSLSEMFEHGLQAMLAFNNQATKEFQNSNLELVGRLVEIEQALKALHATKAPEDVQDDVLEAVCVQQ